MNTGTSGIKGITPQQQFLLNQGLTFQMVAELSRKSGSFTDMSNKFEEGALYTDLKEFAENFFTSKDLKSDTLFAAMYRKYTLSDKTGNINERRLLASEDWQKRQDTWTAINNNWEQFVHDHKLFLKQNAILSLKEVSGEEDNENKNQNEYTKNYFQIDYKNTAPAAIQILYNTLARSIFDEHTQVTIDGKLLPNLRNVQNDIIAMPTLYGKGRELMKLYPFQDLGTQ
jgi:hypothetical protein